jgi:hypothetical protein
MVQEFIVLKMKYKGTEIIFRRWFKDGKEEIQVDDNFARLMGFPSKEELIKEMLKDTEFSYNEGDTIWVLFDDTTQNVSDILPLTIDKAEHV